MNSPYQLEERLQGRIRELFLASVPRYYDHTLKVVAKMKEIIKEKEPREAQLLILAAYLHDIGYIAPHGTSFAGEIPDQQEKIEVHSQAGATIARQLLGELGLEPGIIDRVSGLVAVHHRQDLDDPLLKILLEADTL